MANSGVSIGNQVGGRANYWFCNWQLAGQEIDNNRSLINFQAYARFQNSDNQLDNGRVDWWGGNLWYNGGRVKNYDGNFSNKDIHLASGSFWVGHYGDGSRDFGMSGGIDYYGSGRSEGSGSWWLPTIPRGADPTTNKGSYDIGEAITVYTNRKSGSFTHTVRLEGGSGGVSFGDSNGVTDNVTRTFSQAQIDQIYSLIPNANSFDMQIAVYNNNVGEWRRVTRWLNVVDANPDFANFTYKDANPATVAITG